MPDVYIKNGDNFIPCGCLIDKDVLYDGIWAVECTSSGRQITNLSYIEELIRDTEISQFNKVKAFRCAQKILTSSDFQALLSKPHSLNELVTFVVGKVYEQNQ
jgi:hypothetical protein